MLATNFENKIDYLRISVTDRCNLRCVYCMPAQGIIPRPREEILTFKEITRLAGIFASLGVNKIRLTGGEPLVRKGLVELIQSLYAIEGIKGIFLTTNGILLSAYARQLKEAGVSRINVSLDTLRESRFSKITRVNAFGAVMQGIDRASELFIEPLRLNMVVIRGVNDDEITDFVDFSLSKGLILRFIEFMNITPLWRQNNLVPIEEVRAICARKFRLEKTVYPAHGPAEYYRVEGQGVIGFINTSENNCRRCSRLRLTSCGELKLCLYEQRGLCLRSILREGIGDEQIRESIRSRLGLKRYTEYKTAAGSSLYMCSIGG